MNRSLAACALGMLLGALACCPAPPALAAPPVLAAPPAPVVHAAPAAASALRGALPAPPAVLPAARGQLRPAAQAAAQPLFAPVPIVLPHPPPITNQTSSTLYSALLAIPRAQQIDPQAAQTAAFAYVQALQEYRSGNIAAANISALSALATAGSAQVHRLAPEPLPTPALVSQPPQLPGLSGGLYGGDAPAIDADSFLALARGIIDDCAARHDRRLPAAKIQYAKAQQDFAARNFEATRLDAKAAIDACAKFQP